MVDIEREFRWLDTIVEMLGMMPGQGINAARTYEALQSLRRVVAKADEVNRRAEVVEQKFYHSGWTMTQLLEARHGGMVIDEGEAWFYSHTSKDGLGGEYDLLYRRASPPAPAVAVPEPPAVPDAVAIERGPS